MYVLLTKGQFTVVLPEVIEELITRAKIDRDSAFHRSLVSGGQLSVAQTQILASVVAEGGDQTVPERGIKHVITESVGKVIHAAATNEDRLKVAPYN